MKHLKKFNEELVPRFPSYKKGEVVVWLTRNADISEDTVKDIAKRLGYQVIGEGFHDGYIIKCNPGEENQCGADFVDNYPEFFASYEREDLLSNHLYEKCDDIIYSVEVLRDSLGTLNKFGRANLPKDWNSNIDEIIKNLEDIKHD